MRSEHRRLRGWKRLAYSALAVVTVLSQLAAAQQTSSSASGSSGSSSTTSSLSTSLVTANITRTVTSTSGGQTLTSTQTLLTTFTSTATPSTTTSANATASSETSTPTPDPITLDTRISPGFGVLGAILIITGLPSAFWGHKNRWSSFFLIGFYTFSLACLTLILKFGVLEAINPPSDKIVGVFVFACCVAGFVGGGVAIFFWQQAKYFIGAWGGFALGLWVQCFHDGGLIRPIGIRWILYIGLAVVGFCLCTIPRIHYHVLLASTAIVGATAFVLGIDCFTTANLKEFYIANIGFDALFTKFTSNGILFPVSQMMQIELGLIGAFSLMGAAVQLRILQILQFKLQEITREARRREDELEAQATARFAETEKELELWEKEHGRLDSRVSSFPLMKDQDVHSPGTEETSQFTLVGGERRRSRYASGVSSFMASPAPDEEYTRKQGLGALPAIDLGFDMESNIPGDLLSKDVGVSGSKGPASIGKTHTPQALSEELKKKEELLAEIQSIRKSIDVLRSETPGGTSSAGSEPNRSRHQSFVSRRTMSIGFAEAMDGPSRPPRPTNPRETRDRASSMDRLSQVPSQVLLARDAASISRPSSAPPAEDVEWDTYVRERKLFQPPAGMSQPIVPAGGPLSPQPRTPIAPAVADALNRRHQQEMAFEKGEYFPQDDAYERERRRSHMRTTSFSSDEMLAREDRRRSHNALNKPSPTTTRPPVTILPPRRPDPVASRPEPAPRTYTYEELAERHREKMRDLQAPLSRAEQERARLEDARSRWARSQEVEKREMAKREERRSRQLTEKERKRTSGAPGDSPGDDGRRQSRRASAFNMLVGVGKGANGVDKEPGLNPERLGKLPGQSSTSKRQSVMKVEDWRRYQADKEVGATAQGQGSSGHKRNSNVPFPGPMADRRRSSQGFGKV